MPANASGPTDAAGRTTDPLKAVPGSKPLREQIRAAAIAMAAGLDKSRPMVRHEMESHARRLLADLRLSETYVGWTMVALASAFWEEHVAAVPYERRLLLLPHCLREQRTCEAEYDEFGLLCRSCGACPLTGLVDEARRRGYKVMIAEGSPAVMKIILGGHVDALLGVACLDVLEKTLDKILLAGIPAMAVPLLTNGCRDTTTDEDWVHALIATPQRPTLVETRTYVHLMRCAAQMFEPEVLLRLVPPKGRCCGATHENGRPHEAIDATARTEAIAYDFLAAGGKHSRPFITLAVYDALSGARGTSAQGAAHLASLPDAVKCIALAIEIFHKASLVHDDLEDNDPVRYGQPTLHCKYGIPAAVNVGDFLIGLGYRLVADQRRHLGPQVTAEILAGFAHAHTRLCEGQGAELLWRSAADKRLSPLDALKIYALKTAPAFEAALTSGIRMAGDAEPYLEPVVRFARHLGVAYQVLNDLDDWEAAVSNGRKRGADLLRGRPTVLWALALARAAEPRRRELESLLAQSEGDSQTVARARQYYEQADVFRQASVLIAKHHQRARDSADAIDHEPLRHLLHFLADAILDRRPLAVAEE